MALCKTVELVKRLSTLSLFSNRPDMGKYFKMNKTHTPIKLWLLNIVIDSLVGDLY